MIPALLPADATEREARPRARDSRSTQPLRGQHNHRELQDAAYEALTHAQIRSERAVADWRVALAERWDCEVAALRVYKQIVQQMITYYGRADALEVQAITSGTMRARTTPSELLQDVRRMEAALALGDHRRPFAARLAELTAAGIALERTIAVTTEREAVRRRAAIDRQMAEETYHRTMEQTFDE